MREINLSKEISKVWGLYYDYMTKQFIACDGQSTIYFIEPKDFTATNTIQSSNFHENG